jgi:glyoxylase-like metal-dependent hydrolase (beta-lactamase superfamily II)
MQRILGLLAVGVSALVALSASAQTPPEVTLTRLDCGSDPSPRDVARFSDTNAFPGMTRPFTFSCYVIRHGDDVMVWDTGFVPGSNPQAPKVSLTDQLATLKLTPDQVRYVGISHYHADHTSQLPSLPKATLLIGQGDWDAVNAPKPAEGVNAAAFKHWIGGGGKAEPVALDKDVFGDGTVVMLNTPGHTPGHHSLMVRLKEKGVVILTGDLAHFHENYDSNGVPGFNFNRAATLASLDRVKKLAANLKATVIIQHDVRDIGMLPAFPAAAR